MNRDSVKVDTCSGSATQNEQYAKKWYRVIFTYYAISLPIAPDDTDLEVSWTAINTVYSSLRSSFSALETKYGTLHLKKYAPSFIDSTDLNSRIYTLRFDRYACVDSVLHDLASFPELYNYSFASYPGYADYIPNDRSLKPGTPITEIQSDVIPGTIGSGDYFFQSYWHKRGFGWSNYSMNCPMAWEITQGKNTVVICQHDWWTGNAETAPHSDIVYRKTATPNGNLFLLDPSATAGDPQFHGDGIKSSYALGTDHGSECLPLAISLANNDNLSTPPSGALAGIAPKCLGIGIDYYNNDHLLIDIDGLANNGPSGIPLITHPDIFSYSYHLTNRPIYKDVLNAGCVQIAAAGNGRENGNNPGPAFPSALVFEDPSNPTNGSKDAKIIAVAALEDGMLRDDHCNNWSTSLSDGMYPHYTKGTEWFDRDFNFSHGTDKFNNSTTTSTRITAKEDAHVDVVAPSEGVLTLLTGSDVATATAIITGGSVTRIAVNFGGSYASAPTITLSGGGGSGATATPNMAGGTVNTIHVVSNGTGYTSAPTVSFSGNANGYVGYNPNVSGTSLGTPIVAGVVGLMMSMQKQLGQTGRNVQKKAYDIITFTADKIVDVDNISSGLPKPSGEVNGIFPYVEQTNDPLHRWWTPRMGFGKVNAYRAVAHSIPKKGDHEYTTTQILSYTGASQNEDGKYLMHFGSWKNATDKVLDSGGNSLPSALSPAYNNQGETLVNGTGATTLTVGSNDILAIDGIVKQNTVTLHNNKIVTSSGKILATGMIQDVGLEGKMKLSDLIINGTTSDAFAYIKPSGSFDVNGKSEIYGTVQFLSYGKIILDNSQHLLLMPGSDIKVNGSVDFQIGSSSSSVGYLNMRSASKLETTGSQKIIVNDGSILYIGHESGVSDDAEIAGTVDIKSGGTLEVGPDCILRISNFTIEAGGALQIDVGGRLILTNNSTSSYVCNGSFKVNGSSAHPCFITASQSCDYPVGSNITGTALITIKGTLSGGTVTPAHYESSYGKYTNALLQIIDATKGVTGSPVFYNNSYYINSSWPTSTYPILVSLINHTTSYTSGAYELKDYKFESCTFSGPSDNSSIANATTGLYVTDHYNNIPNTPVLNNVSNSTFSYLGQGINAVLDDNTIINSCTFTPSVKAGVVTDRAYPRVCNSTFTFSSGNSPLSLGAAISCLPDDLEAYDNTIGNYSVGIAADSRFFLRGNTIQNYSIFGVETIDALLFLQSHFDGTNWLVNGRNIFKFLTDFSSGTNAFDVEIYNSGTSSLGDAWVHCGYNKFNSASSKHMHLIDGTMGRTYNVSGNDWLAGGIPRLSANIATAVDNPLLPDLSHSIVSNQLCGLSPQAIECYQGTVSSAHEKGISVQSVMPVLSFSDYLHVITDTSNSFSQRKEALHSAFAKARFAGDSTTSSKLRLLIDSCSQFIGNNSPLKIKFLLIVGDAYSALGDSANAATAYHQITAENKFTMDSLEAAWHLQYLSLSLNKSQPSIELLGNYRHRVLLDIERFFHRNITPPIVENTLPTNIISDNVISSLKAIPNPFTDKTEFRFSLAYTEGMHLEIYDILGRKWLSKDLGVMSSGAQAYELNTTRLAQGTYYARFESANGKVATMTLKKN